MLVAVFGDAHAHGDALDAVLTSAVACGAQQLWSLGDMLGGGPDPERTVAATREQCSIALAGNHDYGATGSVEPSRLGPAAARSIGLARERLSGDDMAWLRSRKPATRREALQCWHGSPRNPVWEFIGPRNAGACLAVQKASLGLVGHTHLPDAWQAMRGAEARRVKVVTGIAIDISEGKWLLNPGAVGAPLPSQLGWWDGLDAQALKGAPWLLLDLDAATATWHRAPFDPAPARRRARAFGLA
ncbi:MAG: metallophosphoesterase family protein [Vicinamibacterales bacterium]